MNREDFLSKYRLIKRVTETGVQTYHATDPSGRVVMVHFLDDADADGNRRRMGYLEELRPVDRMKVVEQVEVDDLRALVTEFLQGFTTLDDWLGAKAGTTPTLAEPAISAGDLEPATGAEGPSIADQATVQMDALPADALPPQPASDAAEGEGAGFTQFFKPGVEPQQAEAPEPTVPPQPPTGGGFTQMFQSDSDPPATGDDPESGGPPRKDGASFTQMFQPDAPADDPTPTPSPPSAGDDPRQGQGGGEFTQLFKGGNRPPDASPPSDQPAKGKRRKIRVRWKYDDAAPPPAAEPRKADHAPPILPALGGPPNAGKPGEFTQLFNPNAGSKSRDRAAGARDSGELSKSVDRPTYDYLQALSSDDLPKPEALAPPPPQPPKDPIPPPPVDQSGPSEFTQIVGPVPFPNPAESVDKPQASAVPNLPPPPTESPAPQPASAAPAAQAEGETGSQKPPVKVLIIGLGAILLLATILVLVIVL